jgi:hypothetical protein
LAWLFVFLWQRRDSDSQISIASVAYFSVFKRGMKGTYQHCAEKHLHRYLAEFDFRYNNRTALGCSDIDRTIAAIKGVEGKRLMYSRLVGVNNLDMPISL